MRPAPRSPNSVILKLEVHFIFNNFFKAGARLTIHDKTLRPLVDEFGYDLMPNTLTEAAIQGVLIERQPKPYPSQCFRDWSQTNYSNYIQNDWNYTLQQCQRACSHSTILEREAFIIYIMHPSNCYFKKILNYPMTEI